MALEQALRAESPVSVAAASSSLDLRLRNHPQHHCFCVFIPLFPCGLGNHSLETVARDSWLSLLNGLQIFETPDPMAVVAIVVDVSGRGLLPATFAKPCRSRSIKSKTKRANLLGETPMCLS